MQRTNYRIKTARQMVPALHEAKTTLLKYLPNGFRPKLLDKCFLKPILYRSMSIKIRVN